MRKVTLPLMGILLCLVGSAGQGLACTCMDRKGDPAYGFKSSAAVFAGKVIAINEVEPPALPGGPKDLAVKIRVEKSWKLVRADEVTVFTINTDGLCGFTFTVGERYLVYAYLGEHLGTTICMRTGLLAYAQEDLEYLRHRGLLKVKRWR